MSQEKLIPADQTKCAELARFVVRTTFDDLPEAIAQKAVRHILDSIGAGTAGAIAPETTILTQTLHAAGEGCGAAPLWGRGEKMTPLNAALVNGTASHAFELDDTGGCDHSGAVVVPAAVAALELAGRPVSGKEFITAVVLATTSPAERSKPAALTNPTTVRVFIPRVPAAPSGQLRPRPRFSD